MAGKQERQRKLARERYERRLARQAQQQQRVRKWSAAGAVVVVLAGVVVAGILTLGGNPKKAAAAATPSPTATGTPAVTPSASPTTTAPAVAEPARHCTYMSGQPAARNAGVPPATPDYKGRYQATILTNRGPIVIDLLNSKATCTVSSFVFLAMKGYFAKTPCHRLTTAGIYVLQCGDPTGTGTGGPGYGFANENLAGATYSVGTVAMAHSSQPDSNGSQFFLVYRNTGLPPDYTPFGRISSGLNIIQKVAKAGTTSGSDGPPKDKVIIESVAIKKT